MRDICFCVPNSDLVSSILKQWVKFAIKSNYKTNVCLLHQRVIFLKLSDLA